ncbi:hypothetical protein WJX73_009000 [Symbiochloris irregularis]|uniref:Uncharacterized protein n=1 Tax=Symbiochloris irregularis TaxID=706552 RepID=A0AAW1NIL3_9CHLO
MTSALLQKCPHAPAILRTDARASQVLRRRQFCRCQASDSAEPAGRQLAADFERFLNESRAPRTEQRRSPSHLMAPTTMIASQLDALQRNDYPDTDSGIRAAYAFTKPYECEDMISGQPQPARARSWHAQETWLSYTEFHAMLHSVPYKVLLGCDRWEAVSGLNFPSRRHSDRAIQAVKVFSPRREASVDDSDLREHTFTFCLQEIAKGPYKGCWMTIGCRVGDYANV